MTVNLDGDFGDVLRALPHDLRQTLGSLAGERDGIALLAIAALPTGSRAMLVALGIIKRGKHPGDLKLTKFGRRVIEFCKPWGEELERVT